MSEPQLDRREMSLMQKLSIPEESDPPWSILIALIIVFVLLINLTLVGTAISSVLLGLEDTTAPTPFTLLLGWTIGQALTIVYVVINRRSSQESWIALKLNRGLLPLQLVLMVGVAIALTIDVIVNLASGQFLPVPEIFGFQADGVAGILMAGLFLVLIQPVAESLVFQGVLLPKLRIMLGAWGGVLATTIVFTLIHYGIFYLSYQSNYPESAMLWYGIVYPLAMGLLFCLVKVYTESTRAVIIARMGAGATFLLTALVLVG
jgi:membrane protease YdiL (CAAX protease family)